MSKAICATCKHFSASERRDDIGTCFHPANGVRLTNGETESDPIFDSRWRWDTCEHYAKAEASDQ